MQLAAPSDKVPFAPLGFKKPLGIATAFMALAIVFSSLFITEVQAETRTLKMYFTHTKESTTFTFKKNGKYVSRGLKKANRFYAIGAVKSRQG